MCSYCGCESEAAIAELMADHEDIAVLAADITAALDRGDTSRAASLAAEVADRFDRHTAKEETGLFAQLVGSAVAEDAVADLEGDHVRLRLALRTDDPAVLRATLTEVIRHADREDTDLFPAALQLLPDACWAAIGSAHQTVGAADA